MTVRETEQETVNPAAGSDTAERRSDSLQLISVFMEFYFQFSHRGCLEECLLCESSHEAHCDWLGMLCTREDFHKDELSSFPTSSAWEELVCRTNQCRSRGRRPIKDGWSLRESLK